MCGILSDARGFSLISHKTAGLHVFVRLLRDSRIEGIGMSQGWLCLWINLESRHIEIVSGVQKSQIRCPVCGSIMRLIEEERVGYVR